MCDWINYGQKEINTIGELKEAFGLKEVVIDPYYKNDDPPDDNTCLCWVDIPKTLKKTKLKYHHVIGGWWEVKDEA